VLVLVEGWRNRGRILPIVIATLLILTSVYTISWLGQTEAVRERRNRPAPQPGSGHLDRDHEGLAINGGDTDPDVDQRLPNNCGAHCCAWILLWQRDPEMAMEI
jgi:hypothetical protein